MYIHQLNSMTIGICCPCLGTDNQLAIVARLPLSESLDFGICFENSHCLFLLLPLPLPLLSTKSANFGVYSFLFFIFFLIINWLYVSRRAGMVLTDIQSCPNLFLVR